MLMDIHAVFNVYEWRSQTLAKSLKLQLVRDKQGLNIDLSRVFIQLTCMPCGKAGHAGVRRSIPVAGLEASESSAVHPAPHCGRSTIVVTVLITLSASLQTTHLTQAPMYV
jgi:hypothetical protein